MPKRTNVAFAMAGESNVELLTGRMQKRPRELEVILRLILGNKMAGTEAMFPG
jgi:hypothetical protein